ncbi:hypothetical protein G6F40_013810 [Rhizopus arrhizus]|nr:hypothetical protein G6F40_013810 [Rhizopus arrhizus]
MIGKRRRGDRRGQTLHKEALLWRAKEGLRIAPDEPLPLILLREPSVTRTLTLDALARAGRSWQIVCTSTSYAGCQAAARADRQRAGIDGGATGEGVGAGQGLGAAAFLDQAACAADRTAERAVAGITDRQRIGAQVHRAVADQGAELLRAVARREVQRGAGGEVDRAGCRQAGIGTQRQRTGVDVGATGVGVGAVQGQRRAALLGQAARTGQNAIEGQCVGTEHGQPGIERDVVGQRGQPGGVQRRRTADSERTGTQRGVVAQHQAAGIECHATTEGRRCH